VNVQITADDLRPIVETVVAEVLAQRQAVEQKLDRIGYTEAEAAELLGMPRHKLRDARLRGEITARKVGRGFLYSRQKLIEFAGSEH
jgi:excisionase family DNA binding protein